VELTVKSPGGMPGRHPDVSAPPICFQKLAPPGGGDGVGGYGRGGEEKNCGQDDQEKYENWGFYHCSCHDILLGCFLVLIFNTRSGWGKLISRY